MAKEKVKPILDETDEEVVEELKQCFFITPIGEEASPQFNKMNDLLSNVLNPVLEEYGYETVVAHEIQKIGSIGDQVFDAIRTAHLIISNLTKLNPNVMYETAVAHSFGKPTIMLVERDGPSLPFDLNGDRTIFFDDSIGGSGKLKDELIKKIEHIQKCPDVDNPVLRVMKTPPTSSLSSDNEEYLTEISEILTKLKDTISLLDKNEPIANPPKSTASNTIALYFKNWKLSPEDKTDIIENIAGFLVTMPTYQWSEEEEKLRLMLYTSNREDFKIIRAGIQKRLKDSLPDNASVEIKRLIKK